MQLGQPVPMALGIRDSWLLAETSSFVITRRRRTESPRGTGSPHLAPSPRFLSGLSDKRAEAQQGTDEETGASGPRHKEPRLSA